jgi:hypothetical protein
VTGAPTDIKVLEARLAHLEDEREIQALVYRYATLCDQAYEPDGLAELFTEDATWSSRSPDGELDFGRHDTREGIRAHFAEISASVAQPTLHAVTAPDLDIAPDGRRATGRWYTLVLLTMAGERAGQVLLLGATYHQEYRKTDGRWLFTRVDATLHFHLPVKAA